MDQREVNLDHTDANILNIQSIRSFKVNANICLKRDLNPRPSDLASDALPTEPLKPLCLEWVIVSTQFSFQQLSALNNHII